MSSNMTPISIPISICLVLSVVFVVKGFNLDSVDYAKHSGSGNSMFGFSVASHSFSGQNWVLIGAPEAQSQYQPPSVHRGGAVYFCPVDRDDGCREIPFDRSGNNNSTSYHQIDEKSRQWFGATVNSGGMDQPVVACAPRYLWYTTLNNRRDPVGTCYVAQNGLTSFSEFSPCRTRHWGYHRQGTCQAGLGAAVSKNGERLFIGAPGSWYWQGQLYSIYSNTTLPYVPLPNHSLGEGQMYSVDPDARLPYSPPRYSDFGAGQVYSQNLRKRPSVFFTKEGEALDDDSYMGYSVTTGNFTGDKEGGVAAGMPRGNRLKGKVVMYTWNLTNHQNISGSQLGAYFGYAIASADMNGDGLDDLIVGAPLHTEPNTKEKYEVGRVYVIYPVRIRDDPDATPNQIYPKLRKFDTRDGTSSKGRFGLSVANLGDLDLDGYQDIAIGAPYDGPKERGAVYIYYGSKNGIREKPSQVIYGEELGYRSLYTFGFSVSGNGIDLDRNQYPDLVVGAYLSNSAFIFRSRPVINIEANVKFHTYKKQISLDERNCSLGRNKNVSCTSFETCVRYNGIGVSHHIELITEFILDSKITKDPRMFLFPHERRSRFNETFILRRNDWNCTTIQVYIRDTTRDKLTPLEVEMKYYLNQRQKRHTDRNPRNELLPVLNGNLPSSYKDSIVIKKNCGEDDVCIPNLYLVVSPNVEKYLMGSEKRLKIDVKVHNYGEDSFESMFYMKVPPGINYFNTEQIDGSKVQCSAPSEATNNTLKCDIGNPLAADKMVHFRVLLDPFHFKGMKPSYDFSMKVNSTNPEEPSTVGDNVKDLSVKVWVETNISLTGWAQYPDIHYKEEQYQTENYTLENDIGPQIVHIYSIKNNGPSDINEADILFMWPSKTLEGDDLLYLMEQPELQGKIACEYIPDANPLKVELLSRKNYLEQFASESSKLSGQVSYEEEESHTATTGVVRHDEKKMENEDKFSETGDGSYVHVDRQKEINKIDRGSHSSGGTSSGSFSSSGSSGSSGSSSSSSGNTGTIQREYNYQWNTSSSSGGNPNYSWTRNTTTISGRKPSIDPSINYNIIYTSTGNQQGTTFDQDKSFSVSGGHIDSQFENRFGTVHGSQSQSQSGHSQSGHSQSGYSQSGYGSQTGQQGGQTGQSGQTGQTGTSGTTGTRHGYFNWDNGRQGTRTGTSYGTVQTHGERQPGRRFGQSGSISGTGEMVYSQGARQSGSGYGQSQSGTGTGEMVFSQSGTQQSGSHLHGSGSGYGQSGTGTRDIVYSQSGTQQTGSSYGQTGTSTGEMVYSQSGTGSIYNEFIRLSGYNLTGLVSEEDLRRMMQIGSGEFNNGTHRIKWSTQYGGFKQQNQNDTYKPYTISTEESVNQNLDEYTRRVQNFDQNRNRQTNLDTAAQGSGFRTTGLDLGIAKQEKDYSATYYDPDLNSYEERSQEQESGIGYGSSRTFSTGRQHSRTYVGDNVPTDHPLDTDYRNRLYRSKRQVEDEIKDIIQCKSTKCNMVRCKSGPLSKDEEAWASLRFRAKASTLKKIGWNEVVTVSSMMISRINKLPYIGTPLERPIHTHEVFTNMTLTETEIKPDVVPLWVVVLSACAGTIILLLLIFLFYKCGFFKRNRPYDNTPERQPLNRNGHYHGDEQL